MSTEIAISTSGWSRRRRSCEATHPTTAPTAMPPSTTPTNSSVAEPSAKLAAPTTPIATCSALRPVPSLTRLSPSRIALTRSGAPSPRMIEVAATGSVGPSAAPSTKAISHGSPATKWAATATATVVASTRPTARKTTGRATNRMSSEAKRNADG